jgi:branched-chain amino acid transport system substrate-binding protein
MKRWAAGALLAGLLGACSAPAVPGATIPLAAVYPLSGAQAQGGRDEWHGVQLAATFINRDGGVRGHPVRVQAFDAPNADEAADAVRRAVRATGARVVLGSYGSTIALPAAEAAGELGVTFWETGAVTDMLTAEHSPSRFRTVGTGSSLGGAAVRFARDVVAPRLGRPAATLRVAIVYADDVYGRSVALGHRLEARAQGMPVVLDLGYDPRHLDAEAVSRTLGQAAPDVLFSASYLEDGVALRRALLHQGVTVRALIGTSSGFCLPDFGKALEQDAVGLFAADKPDGSIRPEALLPAARVLLLRARNEYEATYHTSMSAAALHGFVGAWVLLREVLPRAPSTAQADVARAALQVDLPMGSLINGSGVRYAPPSAPDAGQNRRAVAIVGQWLAPRVMRTVYPPPFARENPQFIPLPR